MTLGKLIDERSERLREQGYVPRLPQVDYQQSMPVTDNQGRTINDAPYGLPDDWDYRTAKVGPNGDPLPNGAVGWTPHGEPFYGGNSALGNWANGFVSRLSAKSDLDGPSGADFAADAVQALLGEDEFEGASLGGRLGGAFSNGIQAFGAAFKNFAVDDEGTPTPLTYVSRGISGAIGGLLTVAGEVAEEVEQIRGGLIEASGGEMNALDQLIQNSTKDWEGNWGTLFRSVLFSINVPGLAYDALRAAVAPSEGKGERFQEGYEAGRILYSQFIDPAIKEEYMRRLRAGENPYLLAEELQNPIAELGGEIFADPLNFVGLWGKAARRSKWMVRAVDDFARLDDEIDALVIAKKAGEIDDATFIARSTERMMAIAGDTRKGITKLDDALLSLDVYSKRAQIGGRSGAMAWSIAAANKGRPDFAEKTLDIYRALADLHSDDASRVATAMDVIQKTTNIPGEVLMSPVARELGYVMKQLVEDNPTKFLDELAKADTPEKLLETFGGKLDNAIDNLVPSMAQRVEAGEKLTVKQRALLKSESVLKSDFYRGSRKFFGSLYMGYNPGYATRNMLQNYVHLFVDEGLGTVIQEGRLFTPTNAKNSITRILGRIPNEATKGLGATEGVLEGGGFKNFAARWSSNSESNASAQIFAKSLQDHMRTSYDKIFGQSVEEFRKLGVTEGDMRFMRNMMGELHDPNAVRQRLEDLYSDGFVDVYNEFEWIDDGLGRVLDDFGGLDTYKDAMRGAESAEDAITRSNQFFKTHFEDYAKLSAQIPQGLPSELLDDATALIDEAAENGFVADDMQSLNNYQKLANQAAEDSYLDALTHMQDIAKREGVDLSQVYRSVGEGDVERFLFGQSSGKRGMTAARETFDAWANGTRAKFEQLVKNEDLEGIARMAGLERLPPQADMQMLKKYFWEQYFLPASRNLFNKTSDAYVGLAHQTLIEAGKLDPRLVNSRLAEQAVAKTAIANRWRSAAVDAETGLGIAGAYDEVTAVRRLAILNGVATKSDSGASLDRVLLNIINGNLDEGAEKYERLLDVPLDVARPALQGHVEKKGVEFFDDFGEVTLDSRSGAELIPPWMGGDATPDPTRMVAEQLGGIYDMKRQFEKGIRDSFGQRRAVFNNTNAEDILNAFDNLVVPKVNEAKLVGQRVAKATRDFALLDYSERRNIDTILGMIYPYHYWHSRTYVNWMKRIVSNPGVVAGYAKYKDTLAEVHAGAPDWWKYNVNSNELLGLDSENPLFFNLESTLNPLYGLTGVDFNDPYKRTGWMTAMLDDMGKIGPSPWTFLSLGTALALRLKGEEDAAARWAGRLIPQTQTLQALGSMAGLDPFELDPAVSLFSNGVDPYTRTRVGRSLDHMVLTGQISEDQAVDAAYTQTGDIWDEALKIAIAQRAPGQVSSFFFGVGFKGRNIGDLQSDQFYGDFYKLMRTRDTLSTQQFRNEMDNLRNQYPFMDALLISRKAGPERDTALAYNVLGRIPPGGSSLTESVGMDSRLLNMFYDTKGDWSKWAESDKDRFMAGVVDLMAILSTPADATRNEWTQVRNTYSDMRDAIEAGYGEGIHERIDEFYRQLGISQEAANAYKANNPDVEAAMLDIQRMKATDPLLATYYGGYDAIEGYYRTLMYRDIEDQMGDIFGKFDSGTATSAERRQYAQIRDAWLERIDEAVLRMGDALPERKGAEIRPDAPQTPGVFQQDLLQSFEPATVSEGQLISALGNTGYEIVLDFLQSGDPMPASVRRDLSELADELGLSYFALLNVLRGRLVLQ